MAKRETTSGRHAGDLRRYVVPFRADGSRPFRLASHRAGEKGGLDKESAAGIIEANRRRLSDLQERLFASGCWSVLLIFQGMDAAGKDSAVDHVFSGVNPQGVDVAAFKTPSPLELGHNFLWRATLRLPQRGRIGIFNRSYYEECLIVRVHPEILAGEKIPPRLITGNIWRERFEDINAYERHLARNGTLILKFFLNVSRDEQRRRFLDRLDDPAKNWKFSASDISERKLWNKYQAAYQEVIANTATKVAPWHVVPADHKWFSRVVIGSTIVAALDQLDLRFPVFDKHRQQDFAATRAQLELEGKRDKAASGRAKAGEKDGSKRSATSKAAAKPRAPKRRA